MAQQSVGDTTKGCAVACAPWVVCGSVGCLRARVRCVACVLWCDPRESVLDMMSVRLKLRGRTRACVRAQPDAPPATRRVRLLWCVCVLRLGVLLARLAAVGPAYM